VVLLASTKPSPQEFLETCENLIHKNELGISNLNGFIEGSFLWPTQSQDHLAVPILVDLPILVKESGVEK